MQHKNNFPIVLIGLFNVDFGIRYLSSFLNSKGFQTYLIFFNQLRYKPEFLRNDYFTGKTFKNKKYFEKDLNLLIFLLKQLKPRIIGISVTSVTMKTSKIITSEIKKHLDTPVVWGGVHPTIEPQESIRYADIICRGEGEIAMWELAERLLQRVPLSGIKNLWIKTGTEIEKNELRPLKNALDTLPFPDFIKIENKYLIDSGRLIKGPPLISAYEKNIYPIMTSRGCMSNCSFCCNSVIRKSYKGKGPYLRRRSVDNVIEELKNIIKNKPVSSIRFWDDVFIYDNDWIDDFCDKYITYIGKPFICYTSPAHTNKKMLMKLVDSGLTTVFLGIQSGSENTNKKIFSRMQSNQSILDYARLLQKLKIIPRYDIISDNPYETASDNDATVELLLKLPKPYRVQFFSLSYFPRTAITKRALADGIITRKDLEQYSSKSLDNFFMFLPQSKNNKQFFWNCIKAMAVNKHFSKRVVRFCKSNNFFNKHPKLLFFLAQAYLRLFKLLNDKKIQIWVIPAFRTKILLNKFLVCGKAKFLFKKQKVHFLFFPICKKKEQNKFCLRIKNKSRFDLFFILIVEIRPVFSTDHEKTAAWKTKLKVATSSQKNIMLEPSLPYLYSYSNDKRKQLKMIKENMLKLENDKLYVIKAKAACLKRPRRLFLRKEKYNTLGYVLFKNKQTA